MENPQKWFASLYEKNTLPGKDRCVFLLVYYCLLIITAIAIIKANAMIVTDTKPANSNLIINSKVFSTICLTSSYVGGKPHLLISFPIKVLYQNMEIKVNTKLTKKQTK